MSETRNLWRDLAEKLASELHEGMDCGEWMLGEEDTIKLFEDKINAFAKERIVRVIFTRQVKES